MLHDIFWIIAIICFIIICGILWLQQKKQFSCQRVTNQQLKEETQHLSEMKEYLTKDKEYLEEELRRRTKECNNLREQKTKIDQEIIEHQSHLDEMRTKAAEELKRDIQYTKEVRLQQMEQELAQQRKLTDTQLLEINSEQESAQKQLDSIKNSLAVAQQEIERRTAEQEDLDYHRIKISPEDSADIKLLYSLVPQCHNKTVIPKIIWSTYYQKPTGTLCAKILGAGKVVCGIYIIENILTHEVYIGQAVDLATRFKTHIKCGLGAEAAANNKLYKSIREYLPENFTFRVLEQCDRTQLNEKEKFWIEMYQANKYGLNSTGGNK